MEIQRPDKLRSVEELSQAHEWLFQLQSSGQLDAKAADAMNTTLKGAVYLNGKLKMEVAKMFLQAKIKKVTIPPEMLPLMTSVS